MSSEEMKPFNGCGWVEVKTEQGNSSRGRGRKSIGKAPKKQPQRGLGVEQLERMRMEETLKKAAEASGIPTYHDHHLLQCQYPSNVPVRYGAPAPSSNGFQFPQQTINNNTISASGSGVIGYNAWLVRNQQHNGVTNFPYGSGVPLLCSTNPLVRNGPPLETSKELSSTPNLCSHQSFDLSLKKTRLNEDLRRDSNLEVWSNHVHNFFGLMPQSAVTHPNLDECAEVVAVHRRGNSMSSKVFMEYEFFPRKDDRGTTSKEQEFPTIDSVEASSSSSSSHNSSIDLSLKL